MKKKSTSLLALPVLVLAGLAAAPSGAQQDSAARSCATIAAAAERLACYDRAFRARQTEDTQGGRKEPLSAPAGSERPAAAARSEPAPAPQSEPAAAAQSEPAAAAQSRPATAAQSEPTAAAQTESTAPVRREVAARHEAPARREAPKASAGGSGDFNVTVVKIRRIRQIDETFFIADDGQVWRQADQRQIVFPKPPFRAVISSGFLGGQFLKPVGGRFSVRVSEEQQ